MRLFLAWALDGGERSASRFGCSTPVTYYTGRWMCTRDGPGHLDKKEISPDSIGNWTTVCQFSSYCTPQFLIVRPLTSVQVIATKREWDVCSTIHKLSCFWCWFCPAAELNIQSDQNVSVHLMITIQKITSNVQSVPPPVSRHPAQSDCLAADCQGQGDTRLTLTPSVIPNSNYVIMVSDWNCKIFLLVFVL
jgi:hypothetical protein